MITGTSYFVSTQAALTYYSHQGVDRAGVFSKKNSGEIHIGISPPLKDGERSYVNHEGRYVIADDR